MRFNFSFSQALDISGLFFMEKYVYHSQFISKFFFGLHNSFLLLNYNNSFFCIKRSLNFLEASLINRNYVLGIGDFYNFFRKSIKFFKYFTVLNFGKLPSGFLTNFKQYFQPNKIIRLSSFINKKIKQDVKVSARYDKKKIGLKKKKTKFFLIKNLDNRFTETQRKKKNWNSVRSRGMLTPPSIGIIFDISKSYWVLNELKLIKLPIIGLIYPKTELNSRIIQYPIPILHGFDFDFKDWLSQRNLVVPSMKLISQFKENLIDLFFLFLFILISFQSYKKLILKFINKSVIFFKNNNIINHAVVFNTYNNKNFNLAKKFYKKSFLRFYIKLWSKVKINANLFFNKRNIRFIDRSLLWKSKKNEWYLKKRMRTPRKLNAHVFVFRNIYINRPTFWIQKKNVWNFKGYGILRKFKLKQRFTVPFLHTIMYRNLIASPVGRSAFYRLRRWNRKRFEIGFKEKSDLMPFFFQVLRKMKFKRMKRKRKTLFFKYSFSRNQNMFKKFRPIFLKKKKKNFQNLYRFNNKPLFFNRRFFVGQLTKKRKKTLRYIIKNVLQKNLPIKHRFFSYLKTKIVLNNSKRVKRPFLTYYSSRFWWYYKMPIVAFSLLNKNSNDNQFFIKYYNEFLHDYTFKLFNLKLNIGMNKSFYLVNHDAKFLKKLFKRYKVIFQRRYNILYRKSSWVKRQLYIKKKNLHKKFKFNNKFKSKKNNRKWKSFVKRKISNLPLNHSRKFSLLYLKKIKRRFIQLYRHKLRDSLNKYKYLNSGLNKAYKTPYFRMHNLDVGFNDFFARAQQKFEYSNPRLIRNKLFLKLLYRYFNGKGKYPLYSDDFTAGILRHIAQQSMNSFAFKMSKYLRRSRVYKRIRRYRYRSKPARHVKFIIKNTNEYRSKYKHFLKRKKYKFFFMLRKLKRAKQLQVFKTRFNFLYDISPRNTIKPKTRGLYRRYKTNGNIFFFKKYMHKIISKFLKVKKFRNIKRFSSVLKQRRKLQFFSKKDIFRFFLKQKTTTRYITKKSNYYLIKLPQFSLIKSFKNFIFFSKKRKQRFFRRVFRRTKWLKNLGALSKIFAIGDLNFRLKLRSKPQYNYHYNKNINYTNKLYTAKLYRNHKRKKFLFFKYSHKLLYNPQYMRNYFSKKFFYFKKYRFVRQINIGLYAYKRLLFKRKKRNKLLLPLKYIKKILRRFKKKIKSRAVILRGHHRKKRIIRQSFWKFKRYKTIKLFMISTIYSTLLRQKSRYIEKDLRSLRLRRQNKTVPWILAKDEFWRYWLAIKTPLFRKKLVNNKKKVKLIFFLRRKYWKFKKIAGKLIWFRYKQFLLDSVLKLKRTRLIFRNKSWKKRNKKWFLFRRKLFRRKLKNTHFTFWRHRLIRIKITSKVIRRFKKARRARVRVRKSFFKLLKKKTAFLLRRKNKLLNLHSKLLKYVSLNLKLRKKNLIQVTQQLKIRTLLHKKLSILINKKRSNYSNLLIIKQYQKNKKKIRLLCDVRNFIQNRILKLKFRKNFPFLFINKYILRKKKLKRLNLFKQLKQRYNRVYSYYNYSFLNRRRKRLPLIKLKKLRIMELRRLFKFLFKHMYMNGFGHRGHLIRHILSFSLNIKKFDFLHLLVKKAIKIYKKSMLRIRVKRFPYVFFFKFYQQFYYKKKLKLTVRRLLNRMILIRYKYMKEHYPADWWK